MCILTLCILTERLNAEMKGCLINSLYSQFIKGQILYIINLSINMAELNTMDQGSIT